MVFVFWKIWNFIFLCAFILCNLQYMMLSVGNKGKYYDILYFNCNVQNVWKKFVKAVFSFVFADCKTFVILYNLLLII